MHKSIQTVLGVSAVWLLVVAVCALTLSPHIPHSVLGWVLFVLLAPLAYLILEMVSEALWQLPLARRLSEHPNVALRMAILVLLGVVFLAVVGGVGYLLTGGIG
jgi:hypothetical protein